MVRRSLYVRYLLGLLPTQAARDHVTGVALSQSIPITIAAQSALRALGIEYVPDDEEQR